MSQMPEYKRGKRDGVRWAISWLHNRSIEMNDPTAKLVLNAAAFTLGVDFKQDGDKRMKRVLASHIYEHGLRLTHAIEQVEGDRR